MYQINYHNSLFREVFENGGDGSGNWDHQGRIGFVGGSKKRHLTDEQRRSIKESVKYRYAKYKKLINRADENKYLTNEEIAAIENDCVYFKKWLNYVYSNEILRKSNRKIKVLSQLTSAYDNIKELRGRVVYIRPNVIDKITERIVNNTNKKGHNIGFLVLQYLPEYIADPLYILKSKISDNIFVIVTQTTQSSSSKLGDLHLSAILDEDKRVIITSYYPERNNISNENRDNRVLYDKKNAFKELNRIKNAIVSSLNKSKGKNV